MCRILLNVIIDWNMRVIMDWNMRDTVSKENVAEKIMHEITAGRFTLG